MKKLSLEAQLVVKRAIDIVAAIVLLWCLAPLLLLSAILVRLTSAGPVFYSGTRWGYLGAPFACHKFRTMVVDGDAVLAKHGLLERGTHGRLMQHDNDPRVTRFGRFMRRCSIDELPQLLNVIRGEMSLVGPRPLALSMLEDYRELGIARSVMRPGITGLWQVRNRKKSASVLDMIDDDLEYVRRYSFWLDVQIVFATIPRILEPRARRTN